MTADGKPRPGLELQQEWATNDSRTLRGELATLTHTSVRSGQDRRTPVPLCDVLYFCGLCYLLSYRDVPRTDRVPVIVCEHRLPE
jgi:hypothetical protein